MAWYANFEQSAEAGSPLIDVRRPILLHAFTGMWRWVLLVACCLQKIGIFGFDFLECKLAEKGSVCT